MPVYMVTWNLNSERANYHFARSAFIQNLERYQNIQDPGLESVRWISSTYTAEQVCADLQTRLDATDRLFVTQITVGTHQGWLSKNIWDWINARV
ncbi:hypothetical protein IR012_00435 [Pseudomonas putida]|uniref:hypothetical protein n=1 Tax=Pseudomonas putida TaxID=303 RepID=UPI0018AC1AB3|nr:hypothetical protein [Pseudomonas putida]MBF8668389.1 hypothetical protein [Pseudomonas putida]MBF8710792.1 hypothetical protein [Pseudomonas putida]